MLGNNIKSSTRCLLACMVVALSPGLACSNNPATGGDPFEDLPRRDPDQSTEMLPDLIPNTDPIGPDEEPQCAEDCAALDGPCLRGFCGEDGVCVALPQADGSACDDGDLCTTQDTCVEGVCVTTPVECAPSACATSACDPDTGACVDTTLPDDTPCDSGNLCLGGACQGGSCVGEDPVDCSATPVTQCEAIICDPATGCGTTPRVNAMCDDGDPCTIGDRCDEQGACSGSALDCAAQAGPCQVGTCDALAGACVFSDVNDGVTCDDGSACTQSDVCTSGVCQGALVDCGANACNRATCDPVTGCSLTPVPGVVCDDQDACTGPDVCDAVGTCVGTPLPNPPTMCP